MEVRAIPFTKFGITVKSTLRFIRELSYAAAMK